MGTADSYKCIFCPMDDVLLCEKAYASSSAAIAAPIISGLSTLMVRAYCDKVVKLSATLQTYAPEKEVVCNVHGVRSGTITTHDGRLYRFILSAVKCPHSSCVFRDVCFWFSLS